MVPRYHRYMGGKLLPLGVQLHHTEQDSGMKDGTCTLVDKPFIKKCQTDPLLSLVDYYGRCDSHLSASHEFKQWASDL